MGFRMLSALFSLCVLVLAGCSSTENDGHAKKELHVMAAISLSDALKELELQFEKEHPQINIILNFAASGTLQRQIEQGAPADLFISASEAKFKKLQQKDMLHPDFTTDLLQNELVVITGKKSAIDLSSTQTLSSLQKKDIKRFSIGVPDSVPAGQYAKEALQESSLWSNIEDRIVYAKDVRQVLAYVETGNADIGFVYATDVKHASDITVLHKIDPTLHTAIIYPAGILKGTKHLEQAERFYQYLQGSNARAIFQDFGFTPID
ncbi:molybdate ABC transporter substrate-binding protein [Pseudalkalibacillus sp. SCS-8]|uniref:molybdate ABC transporter substrate-binding protein n=1 Tax=Pseudalkalibacillus nanhaiensis TaxID=3115291 RepID=UPI0032DB0332